MISVQCTNTYHHLMWHYFYPSLSLNGCFLNAATLCRLQFVLLYFQHTLAVTLSSIALVYFHFLAFTDQLLILITAASSLCTSWVTQCEFSLKHHFEINTPEILNCKKTNQIRKRNLRIILSLRKLNFFLHAPRLLEFNPLMV